MATQVTHPRFTVEEYRRLFETGVFPENRRVELINGELSEMSPIGGEHIRYLGFITRLLILALQDSAFVSVQGSMRIGDRSEPEPDIVVLAQPPEGREPPYPEDVLLLIEVADTSLAYDRDIKAPLYAEAGIPEYWIADISHRQVIRHRHPTPAGYELVDVVIMGEQLVAGRLPAVGIALADIFA